MALHHLLDMRLLFVCFKIRLMSLKGNLVKIRCVCWNLFDSFCLVFQKHLTTFSVRSQFMDVNQQPSRANEMFSTRISTLEANPIYTSFRKKIKTFVHSASFSGKFRGECKLILYLPTLYLYCVYPTMSKCSKQLPSCMKIAETSVVLIVFNEVLCEVLFSYRNSTWIRYQKSFIRSMIK
jgi:hypothetical protein